MQCPICCSSAEFGNTCTEDEKSEWAKKARKSETINWTLMVNRRRTIATKGTKEVKWEYSIIGIRDETRALLCQNPTRRSFFKHSINTICVPVTFYTLLMFDLEKGSFRNWKFCQKRRLKERHRNLSEFEVVWVQHWFVPPFTFLKTQVFFSYFLLSFFTFPSVILTSPLPFFFVFYFPTFTLSPPPL